jgi:prepilin peptidase CpaA
VFISLPLASQLAIVVAALAAVVDVRTKRIPNILTFGGALCACLLQWATDGTRGLALSVAGALIGAVIFLPFFALGGMGAGDVKLVGAIGACLGPLGALHVAFGAAVAGGVLAILMTLRSGYFGTSVANLGRLIAFWRTHGFTPLPDLTLSEGSGPRLAYAVPILIGTLGALWFR